MNPLARAFAAVMALNAPHALAQAHCSDDGTHPPAALFERFINADCEACWSDPATPAPGPSALVLDWMVPGTLGDEAPLSAIATRDALERLAALGRTPPARTDVHTGPVNRAPNARLQVGLGPPVNDYVGATMAFSPAPSSEPHPQAWTFYLLLVEALPAGAEGTLVARNIVRNMLKGSWIEPQKLSKKERFTGSELRPMRFPDGAQPERLRAVGWVQDAQGRVVAAAQSVCR